mmetsp:Transcript_79569/g.202756  ORF Transcript_79569/g.202756 Transcript_79569/m.202756 type:complete len:268 (+) Transcript_79569:2828-3631(+)
MGRDSTVDPLRSARRSHKFVHLAAGRGDSLEIRERPRLICFEPLEFGKRARQVDILVSRPFTCGKLRRVADGGHQEQGLERVRPPPHKDLCCRLRHRVLRFFLVFAVEHVLGGVGARGGGSGADDDSTLEHFEGVIEPEVLHRHPVLCQRACLVRANARRGAERLDDLQVFDENVTVVHALGRDAQARRHGGGQALRDVRAEDRDHQVDDELPGHPLGESDDQDTQSQEKGQHRDELHNAAEFLLQRRDLHLRGSGQLRHHSDECAI